MFKLTASTIVSQFKRDYRKTKSAVKATRKSCYQEMIFKSYYTIYGDKSKKIDVNERIPRKFHSTGFYLARLTKETETSFVVFASVGNDLYEIYDGKKKTVVSKCGLLSKLEGAKMETYDIDGENVTVIEYNQVQLFHFMLKDGKFHD